MSVVAGALPWLMFNLLEHGDIVRHEWQCFPISAGNVTVIETICPIEQYLETLGKPPADYPHY